MKIQEARHLARIGLRAIPADRLELAALTMAAVLDEIERECNDGNDIAHVEILSILNGERP